LFVIGLSSRSIALSLAGLVNVGFESNQNDEKQIEKA
jgi:hypothetical protein